MEDVLLVLDLGHLRDAFHFKGEVVAGIGNGRQFTLNRVGVGHAIQDVLHVVLLDGELRTQSSSGEEQEMRERHARYFLELAETAEPMLTGGDQRVWLDRLEVEHANLQVAMETFEALGDPSSALRVATSLWYFFTARGYMRPGRRLLERLLAANTLPDADKLLRARALHGLGTLCHNLGENLQARSLLEEALALFRELQNHEGTARELNNLAWVALELGDFEVAANLAPEALALNQELELDRGIAVAYNNLGWLDNYQGRYASAVEHHSASLELRRSTNDHRGVAFAQANLGWAECYHGDLAAAISLLDEASDTFREFGDDQMLSWAQTHLGIALIQSGEFEHADRVLNESLAGWRSVENVSGVAWTLSALGDCAVARGELTRARDDLAASARAWEQIDSAWGIELSRLFRGRLERIEGNRAAAVDALGRATETFLALGDLRGVADGLDELAIIAADDGDDALASQLLAGAVRIREELDIATSPGARARTETRVEQLKGALGADRFAREWSRGRTMTTTQVVELILGL